MNINIEIEGLDELRRTLAGFSDRRFAAVLATTLTRTAAQIRDDWRLQVRGQLDRPTPLTTRSPKLEIATASRLEAVVSIDASVRDNGVPPAEYLKPQEFGGGRAIKMFERALQAMGSMPSGYRAVPGKYATLDAYGNVRRQQLVQVIAQLGRDFSPGYARVISAVTTRRIAAAKRHGREYVAVTTRRGKLNPGIYQRSTKGMLPVFFFVSTTQYRSRLTLIENAERIAGRQLKVQAERAVAESWARLQARRA